MKLIDSCFVNEYAKTDWIAKAIKDSKDSHAQNYKSEQWLHGSAAKRAIFHECYGDLLSTSRKRVLDVGGGLSSFTGRFAGEHAYTLVDPLFHHDEDISILKARYPECEFLTTDWREINNSDRYDIVIANDVFPNVDQGIDQFIKTQMLHCAELRISITWHEKDRYYRSKRTDAEEVLTVVPWTGEQIAALLKKYERNIRDYCPEIFTSVSQSAFPNGRSVAMVVFDFERSHGV